MRPPPAQLAKSAHASCCTLLTRGVHLYTVRHSRPCNVVTFCPNQPGLLAVGLEKGRGESLLIYDIETSARSLDSGKDTPAPNSNATATPKTFNHRDTAIRAHSPAPPAPEPFVQLAFGSSESVSSAAFLASEFSKPSSPLLVAAMAGKWLRAYDLRDPPTTVMTWGTRAVHSIAASPFNDQQFVSSGEDGIVRLWDLRKPMDPLLSFSEVDAGAISAKVRPTVVAKPLTEILWSPTQRGVLTTLEKDSNSLRVWNLADGPLAKVTEVGADDTAERNRASSTQHHASSPSIGSVDSMRLPVLLDDQRRE